MTRLQKKCLLAAAGTHLLVVVALLCSGFVRPRPKPDATPVIDFITLPTDLATTGETPAPTPPPPAPAQPILTPPTQPPPVPTPEPIEVKPIVKTPDVEPPDQPERPNDPDSDLPKPPTKPPKKHHEVDLKVVTRPVPKVRDTSEEDKEADRAEKAEQKRIYDQKLKAFNAALNNLNSHLSTAPTEFHLPGNDNASRANYLSIVVSAYRHAWISPSHMTGESAVVTFAVTIDRDGSVVSARIESRSGDASVDDAVQRMLNRVTGITPFPSESTDRERTYHIDFNATRTSQ
jgi:protein TonB